LSHFIPLFCLATLPVSFGYGQEIERPYVPGPVTELHLWLGGECSFVPDLDVGECCRKHDEAYQRGGDWLDRLWADLMFRECILDKNRPVVARIYYRGVRTFGWLFFNYD
jgi:hypothetical protein